MPKHAECSETGLVLESDMQIPPLSKSGRIFFIPKDGHFSETYANTILRFFPFTKLLILSFWDKHFCEPDSETVTSVIR